MQEITKTLRGNGHLNVSNVNSINTECILLTYTVWNFKDTKQITEVKNKIYEIVDAEISFDLETKDWTGEDEKYKLKCKVKSCKNEKKAHLIKQVIDEYIKKKGGQTTLDETLDEDE